eukprot:358736-Chlamydomonas_euryale.AAC.4
MIGHRPDRMSPLNVCATQESWDAVAARSMLLCNCISRLADFRLWESIVELSWPPYSGSETFGFMSMS